MVRSPKSPQSWRRRREPLGQNDRPTPPAHDHPALRLITTSEVFIGSGPEPFFEQSHVKAMSQTDVDAWFATPAGPDPRRTRAFLRWAMAAGHAPGSAFPLASAPIPWCLRSDETRRRWPGSLPAPFRRLASCSTRRIRQELIVEPLPVNVWRRSARTWRRPKPGTRGRRFREYPEPAAARGLPGRARGRSRSGGPKAARAATRNVTDGMCNAVHHGTIWKPRLRSPEL
jgi:hypothetical protein